MKRKTKVVENPPDAPRTPAEVFPPSEFIRDEMEARRWEVDTLVRCSWLKREAVEELLAGSRRITPVFADGLGRAFGTPKDLWLNLQRAWDRRESAGAAAT